MFQFKSIDLLWSAVMAYLTTDDITYENLNANSDVGTGADQVAAGDHSHSGLYPSGGTADHVLTKASGDDYDVEWAAAPGAGASQLSELSDVGVTTATNRNGLMADGDSWESRAIVEADISDLGTYITTTSVTYETLNTNSDVGTGASQVAAVPMSLTRTTPSI